jgi:hypothetical protein
MSFLDFVILKIHTYRVTNEFGFKSSNRRYHACPRMLLLFFFYRYLSGMLCKKKICASVENALALIKRTQCSVKELLIKKYLQNQTYESILRVLSKLNVKRNFVYQTVKRYIETGNSERRKYTTLKRSVTTRVVVKKIRERIRQKCDILARKSAEDLKLNRETVRLVLKNDLQLSANKKNKNS